MLRAQYKHVYALTILASKIDVLDDAIHLIIVKKTLRVTAMDLIPTNPTDEQD